MQFGSPVPKYMAVTMKQKIGLKNYNYMFMEAPKLTASEALEMNVIQMAAPMEELYEKTIEFAESKSELCVDPMACKVSKEDIFEDSIKALSDPNAGIHPYAKKKLYEYKDMLAKI